MSLSKNIGQCRKCLCIPSRTYQTGSSNAVEAPKMQSRTSMSLTQWKVVNQLKDYISKVSNDKTLQNALNKEVAHLMQRFQPTIYGNDIIRNFESNSDKNSSTVEKSETKKETSIVTAAVTANNTTDDSNYMLPNVLKGLKMQISGREEPNKEITPKWKTESPAITKSNISSRTRHIILSIAEAQSDESKLSRIEALIAHMMQFPESKNSAVQEGAISLLLKIRMKTKASSTLEAINEAFALLGYTDPLPEQGIRILSIDGGGTRGILVIELLKKLEELTGKKIYELFDFICGVSTGAIIATSLAILKRDLDHLSRNYKEMSTKIFTQSPVWGASSLVWSHSYYDTALWEKILKDEMGEEIMIKTCRRSNSPKLATLSAVVNQSRLSAFIFRNYSLPWRVQSEYMGSNKYHVWQAVRASAAAPTYFEEFKLGNFLHQDGGILYNNPTAVAIHEAKLLWPESPIQCVLSFGTGRTTIATPTENVSQPEASGNSSWKNKFMKILDSATDTEGVHTVLSDLLPSDVYYRFNPYLKEMLSMVEIHPEKLEQLERDAMMYIRRNEDKFQQAAKSLLKTKSPKQKAIDWLKLKGQTYGIPTK